MKFTGKAIIRVNGREWRTEDDGAKLNTGGENRTPKTGGGKVHGYNEETVPPQVECNMLHSGSDDLTAINAITGATLIFETDSGDRYVLREAFVLEPAELEVKSGTASVKFSALGCERY